MSLFSSLLLFMLFSAKDLDFEGGKSISFDMKLKISFYLFFFMLGLNVG